MESVYFVSVARPQSGVVRKRTGGAHQGVYHGCGMYLGESTEKIDSTAWQRPALSNTNRERLHVSRSGRFVPAVWCPNQFELVVCTPVKDQLFELQGIEFQPVVFEKLVDWPLPPTGDTSEDSDGLYCNADMKRKIASLPDCADFHHDVGEYFKLLMPRYCEVSDTINDEILIDLQFGRYNTLYSPTVPLSVTLLERHAMYQVEGTFCLTERAFELLAPSLDLDYFLVEFLSLMRKYVFDPELGMIPEPLP